MKLDSSIFAGRFVWTILRFSISFGFACFADAASAQLTLVSTVQDHSSVFGCDFFGSGYGAMAAWTQDRTCSQISIAALLNGGPHNDSYAVGTSTGTFYLMTRVGPGTTTASELARASFSVTSSYVNPQLVQLFSGLTLGPGTYYLVGSGSGGGWQHTDNPTVTKAPGISLTAENFQAVIYDPYIPGNNFRDAYGSTPPPYNLEFVVSVVPEPTAGTLFGVGSLCLIGVLAVGGRRRSARRSGLRGGEGCE